MSYAAAWTPLLFEDVPASDRQPGKLYLGEVENCDLYVGLFGNDYGNEDEEGIAPTEREFLHATALGKHRLIFVKGAADECGNPVIRQSAATVFALFRNQVRSFPWNRGSQTDPVLPSVQRHGVRFGGPGCRLRIEQD